MGPLAHVRGILVSSREGLLLEEGALVTGPGAFPRVRGSFPQEWRGHIVPRERFHLGARGLPVRPGSVRHAGRTLPSSGGTFLPGDGGATRPRGTVPGSRSSPSTWRR